MKKIILLWMIFIPLQLLAAEDVYRFNTPAEQERFATLTSELRCLVCQNQTLAESNASLAADLRQQVYAHIRQGQSDREIVNYLVARYGDFILYKPPFNPMTYGLWLAPILFLLMGIFYLLFYIRKRRKKS
ncbi:MAG TPA: cytochrome c-type biogenesis protein [Gammaproteobacteria bacterium]|nr:cytochrome c-type biogenesis protein [Gammaproteobacteria bacterium]